MYTTANMLKVPCNVQTWQPYCTSAVALKHVNEDHPIQACQAKHKSHNCDWYTERYVMHRSVFTYKQHGSPMWSVECTMKDAFISIIESLVVDFTSGLLERMLFKIQEMLVLYH